MAKRPTPKKRKPKMGTRVQHAIYEMWERRRLTNRLLSPFSPPAPPKRKKEVKGVTRIKA